MSATPRLIDAREFAELGEPADGRHELVGGILEFEEFPAPLRARIAQRLRGALESHAKAHDLGQVFGRVGYVLAEGPDTVRGSDLSFVSKSRMEGQDLDRFFPGAPELAVEIAFPPERREEIHAKVADYLAAGARVCWVVDPDRRRVAIYRNLLYPTHLSADETLTGEDVLPGFAIKVATLFEKATSH